MEWLGLQLFADLPATGRIVIDCRHEPFLVLLAYLVACAACFATLDMAERQSHSEDPTAHRQWNMLGACCLAGGIWAMHFISMLAFQAPVEVHYDASLTILSLLIALAVAWLAMHSLDRSQMRAIHYLRSAVLIGLGIILMHFVGMAALETGARQYYQTGLLLASATIALLTSLTALYLARYFRQGSGTLHQAMKYGASLLMAGGIVATHFTAMSAMTLVIPADTALRLPSGDNSLQLALGIGFITMLISAASISTALADKKLQSKEHDLRRVSVLLSQLDQARASLQQAAHYDALTNLVNRRGFNQVFAERLAEHQATESHLAVMFLDIDHFKRINDLYGHLAGDEVLCHCVRQLQQRLRQGDCLGRYGGEEFLLLLPGADRSGAMAALQGLREAIARNPASFAGDQIELRFSVGLWCGVPGLKDSTSSLLAQADAALYQAKAAGRNTVHMAAMAEAG